MTVQTSYFTFGHGHRHQLPGFTFDKDVIVAVTAKDPRAVMFTVFGNKWSMQHDDPDQVHNPEFMRFFSRGVKELRAMPRIFEPLPESHPALRHQCCRCDRYFEAGDRTVLVDGVPASPEDQAKADADKAHTVEAKLAHAECEWPSDEAIRAMDERMGSGESAEPVDTGSLAFSTVIAVVRRMHELGPDHTDENGTEAYERVTKALTTTNQKEAINE